VQKGEFLWGSSPCVASSLAEIHIRSATVSALCTSSRHFDCLLFVERCAARRW
jgi:hypothetical protein